MRGWMNGDGFEELMLLWDIVLHVKFNDIVAKTDKRQ
jgi:hypothetical protein